MMSSLGVIGFIKDLLHCIRKAEKFKKKQLIFCVLSYTKEKILKIIMENE